jgi:transposase
MAKYKNTEAENGQGMFLTVNLKKQLLPGTFEYMLNDLIGKEIDISIFDENYNNDRTGAKAIPPAALIKLVIYGYFKGVQSSRKLDEFGRNNIIAKALTNDLEPHWTTIAEFISGNSEKFQEVFVKVLAYCGELGLIGGETFAPDGLRLSSNASMEMSGTKAELEEKLEMYRKMAEKHTAKHRKLDESGGADAETTRHYQERRHILQSKIAKISGFLKGMEQKGGKRVEEVKSNVTDNESAMIRSSSGFLQGYIGIAMSDKENQIIISAEAAGSANEGEHLPEVLDEALQNIKEAGVQTPKGKKPTVLADNNYFSEENLRACKERGLEAIIPDSQYRKQMGKEHGVYFEIEDFKYHEEGNYYECPNGKRLDNKKESVLRGKEWITYQASAANCRTCLLNAKCIRTKKDRSTLPKGRKLMQSKKTEAGNLCREMSKKLTLKEYQDQYAYRIQIIEPVFSNIAYCKGLKRFTLRGKRKVNGQWKLFCMVHNLGKCVEGYNKNKGYA